MRRLSTAILAIGIALVFVLYMVTYTVGYNQIAIITTFDKASDPDPQALADGKDTGSVMQEPGLKFKWPWPIQRVQTYPTQLQVLEDTPEQLLLSDDNTIIINMSLTWRVENPLAFFKSLGTIEEAEDKLVSQMRSLRSIISNNYTLGDLVNTEADRLRLDALEDELAAELRSQLNDIEPSYGIQVADVTIGKMLYTASTAESVNRRMSSAQEGKASSIRQDGTSQAKAIVSQAESRSETLLQFADSVATQIEVIGIEESNAFLEQYAQAGGNEDLAIYLRQLEAIEQILANRTTFVLDARTFSPLDVLVYGHGGPGNLSRLFNEAESGEQTGGLPAPVSPAEQAEVLRKRITALKSRIAELQAQLESIRDLPVPVQTLSTEARP